jgi:hypothetical protein
MKLALAALSAAALAQAQHAVDPAPDFVPTKLEAPLLEQFTDSSVPPRSRSLLRRAPSADHTRCLSQLLLPFSWEERWSPSHATKKSPVGSGETFSYGASPGRISEIVAVRWSTLS